MAIADAHFSIGKSHRVCEDYARAGILPADRPFAIVSDGCSSSPDTDFGSRLLTVTAQERILHDKDHYAPRGVVWQASSMARALLLPPHCLDATLLTIHQLSSGVFRVYAVGDGAVAARRRDGTVDIWRIQFFPGDSGLVAPAYLTYTMYVNRLYQYIDQDYNRWQVTHYQDGVLEGTETGAIGLQDTQEGWRPLGFWWMKDFDPEDYEYLMVLTDGVESFQKQESPGVYSRVPFLEVMNHITAIKSLRGPFIAKRLKRFLEHTCPKLSWHHNDDVAVAGVCIPELSEEGA